MFDDEVAELEVVLAGEIDPRDALRRLKGGRCGREPVRQLHVEHRPAALVLRDCERTGNKHRRIARAHVRVRGRLRVVPDDAVTLENVLGQRQAIEEHHLGPVRDELLRSIAGRELRQVAVPARRYSRAEVGPARGGQHVRALEDRSVAGGVTAPEITNGAS